MQNPELRRHLWQDFSSQKLVILPLFLITILYLAHFSGHNHLMHVSYALFYFILILGGSMRVSRAMCNEINDNTWDWQRTSKMTPSELVVGKLIGGTLYTWYLACFPLLTYILCSTPDNNIAFKIIYTLCTGLFIQALALLLSVEAINNRRHAKLRSLTYYIVPFFMGLVLITLPSSSQALTDYHVTWYKFKIHSHPFFLLSILSCLVWTLIGLYRSMRQQLQYQNLPWIWALFVVYALFYFSGFTYNFNVFTSEASHRALLKLISHATLYNCFSISLLITYFALLSDNFSLIRYKKLIAAYQHRGLREALTHLPKWPIPLLAVLCFSILMFFTKGAMVEGIGRLSPAIFALTSLLFLIRDIFIFHYIYTLNAKRSLLTWLSVYFVGLYALIPMLLINLHAKALCFLFYPSFGPYANYSIVGSCIQIAIFALLLRKSMNTSDAT